MSDTKAKAKAIKSSRRTFLLAAGVGGAATVAAIAARVTVTAQAPASGSPDTPDKKTGKGYQDTAHIRNYYRTTQV